MRRNMSGRKSPVLTTAVFLLLVIGLPLVGAAIKGRDLRTLLRFPPPLDIPVEYITFSWLAVGAVVICIGAFAASWGLNKGRDLPPAEDRGKRFADRRCFPWWGWISIGWTLTWWVLAWTRWSWFESFQCFTFFPLWIGFIVTVNALTEKRVGTCLMRRSPVCWLRVFGTSALFWWIFEWLNRFVRNWHYLGVGDFAAWSYAIHASIAFSTVLPAVAAVAELLANFPRWNRRIASGPAWSWLERRVLAVTLVIAGGGALALTGALPNVLYPSIWIAPLAMALGASSIWRRTGMTLELARGDWRRAATWMMAALICGFFWELWNWRSAAKWIYTIPGVERWHVFEMPLLGYAGYLSFGLECSLVVERVIGNRWTGCASAQAALSSPASARAVRESRQVI